MSNMPSMEELHKDIAYAFSCIDSYFNTFPREDVHNAHICEIGPGKNIIVGLTFKSLGAEQVYVVDKYLKPWTDDYHAPLYRALVDAVALRWPEADLEVFHQCLAGRGHNADGIQPLAEDAETLESIPDNTIDFLCSWAALEHLYNPPQAFARFGAVTKSGGCGQHQVDFRDHFDFKRPLEFLLHDYRWNELPDADAFAWMARRMGLSAEQAQHKGIDANGLIRRVCGYNGNSYRHLDYDDLWRQNGFSITAFDHNMSAGAEYLDDLEPRLRAAAVRSSNLLREELDVVSGRYEVHKL